MIEKIIFDYGGVFTQGSRADFVAQLLGASQAQQAELLAFFRSGFIKQAAKGEWSTAQILDRLQALLGGLDQDAVHHALTQACTPDIRMLQLVGHLKASYPIFLISDSLPPPTATPYARMPPMFSTACFCPIN